MLSIIADLLRVCSHGRYNRLDPDRQCFGQAFLSIIIHASQDDDYEVSGGWSSIRRCNPFEESPQNQFAAVDESAWDTRSICKPHSRREPEMVESNKFSCYEMCKHLQCGLCLNVVCVAEH